MLRLLSHQVADGPQHMATDEALLAGASCSTLRTYTWDRPCLSLGYFQDYQQALKSMDGKSSKDLSMVRRITGGGAIMHCEEVTYCLVAERGTELPQRSQAMFAVLHQEILAGLKQHHVEAALNQEQQGDKHYHADVRCFASPAVNDIILGNGKMLGSASRTFQNRVLIHGSLKLASNDWDQEQAVGCGLSSAAAQSLLTEAISRALKMQLQPGALNDDETALIEDYRQARYADDAWLTQRSGPRACFK